MSRRLSFHRVFLIIGKDLREFSRDRLWMIFSPLSLLMFSGMLWLLPDNPAELFSIGVFPSSLSVGDGYQEFSGVDVIGFKSREALSDAVFNGNEVFVGVALNDGFITGDTVSSISLFLSSSVSPAQRKAAESVVRELCFALQAVERGENPMNCLPVRIEKFLWTTFEGCSGQGGLSLKDKLKPIFFVIILMVEALALAGLISVEIEHQTASALLVTSATTRDLLLAKILTGVLLAVTQVFLFLLLTGGFSSDWLALAVTALAGAWMASSVGMISGAAGRDFLGTLLLGMAMIIPLMIPAFTLLFPGTSGGIIRLIPSYGLVMSISNVLVKGCGLGDVAPYLLELLAWDCILAAGALMTLKRKVEAL